MHLSLIQTFCGNDPEENTRRAELLVAEAAGNGAEVVILQELFQTEYFCRKLGEEYFRLAETIPGPLTARLGSLASSLGVVIIAPFFEKAAPGLHFNSLAVIGSDGSLLGRYRKMHIPEDPGFHEKYYFTPGDEGYKVFRTEYGRIGTLICWDQWFPEAARITALSGAQLLVYPTAIATVRGEGRREKRRYLQAWKTVQRSHAIANGCYVAAVNRIGKEGGSRFWGRSFICDPFGEIIAEAGEKQQILHAELDFSRIENERLTWPFFRDRRVDSYNPLLDRWSGGDQTE